MGRLGIIMIMMGVLLRAEIDMPLQLRAIESNQQLRFDYRGTSLLCEPYGILTLEGFQTRSQQCRDIVEQFYIQHPDLKHWASGWFRVRQFYRVRTLEGKCLVYGNGQRVQSESLLQLGLGTLHPKGVKVEWQERFKRMEQGARRYRRGIWAYGPWLSCFETINEK